jgi:hypothetical protein
MLSESVRPSSSRPTLGSVTCQTFGRLALAIKPDVQLLRKMGTMKFLSLYFFDFPEDNFIGEI